MTRPENILQKEHVGSIEESAHWRLIALLLQRPGSGWYREIVSLYDEVDHPGMKASVENARNGTEGGYLHILGPGGLASPREVAYQTKEDPGKVLADIAGIYNAFAFHPRNEDPVDHISVEANFAGYLCLKESYAFAKGDTESAETVARGLEVFLADHLNPFACALQKRLEAIESGYLGEAMDCLLELIRHRSIEKS